MIKGWVISTITEWIDPLLFITSLVGVFIHVMYGMAYHDKINKYKKQKKKKKKKKEENGKFLYASPTPNHFTDLSHDA